MSKGLPCPNPICNHLFAPTAVQGAAALKCPSCGTVYQFRQGGAPAPAKAPPAARPAAPTAPPPAPPVARPVAPPPPPVPPPAVVPPPVPPPSPPLAAPVAAPVQEHQPARGLVLSEPDMLVKPRSPRGQGGGGLNWLTWVMLVLFLGGAGAGAYFFYVHVLQGLMTGRGPRGKNREPVANFVYQAPEGWEPDDRLTEKMGADLGMSHDGPRAHFVIYYRDYQFRNPSDEELVEEARKRLVKLFKGYGYTDPLQSGGKGRGGGIGGEEALAMPITVTGADNVPMVGECHMMARRGYGYWLMMWGPEANQGELPQLWEAVRAGFKHGEGRDGWKPSPRPSEPFDLLGGKLQVKYVKEVWDRDEDASGAGLAGKLQLTGFELGADEQGRPRRIRLAGQAAKVAVLALPPAASQEAAVAAAKDYILTKTWLSSVSGKMGDRPEALPFKDRGNGKPVVDNKVGGLPGEAHHLLIEGKGKTWFGLLAVVSRPDGVVAIYCECDEDKRAYWLAEFKELVNSLSLK